MTPSQFIEKWWHAELKERSGSQEHFIDLCRLLGEPTPAEADPAGEWYCFERGARKDSGGSGWADVWKRGCFAWEYKGNHANLDAAFNQLRQYALALENPPLLIVSNMKRIRICTNWTNSVSETHEFGLEDLSNARVRDRLKWAMSDPERLRPGESRQAVTERAAATFAEIAQWLRDQRHDPQAVAHFVNRLVFCLFAEDVGLLPNNMFTRMLRRSRQDPEQFAVYASQLFGAMAYGGDIGFEPVAWFNGGLFEDDAVLPLDRDRIDTALKAAALDWSEIDPSILGTLFERGLDPSKRSQLGAHYTDTDKIMRIVEPVIVRPLLSEWESVRATITATIERSKAAKSRTSQTRQKKKARKSFDAFLHRLRRFTVLDPACGSGNFLYLALHALKDIEHRVQLEAEALGLVRYFPQVGPANLRGIEISAYAAELARVSLWIGDIQWLRRNGFNRPIDPILQPLNNIECRDAILSPDGDEPDWPEADAVIGNPPFLGNRRIRSELGDFVADTLPKLHRSMVGGKPDLVCYWFAKAARMLADSRVQRIGLVATNSIRGGTNRNVLKRITEIGTIFEAWSDEPWVVDGAAVRVSIICFGAKNDKSTLAARLNDVSVDTIHSDLSAAVGGVGIDLTRAKRLTLNRGIAFQGDIKRGPFDIPGDLARKWLLLPNNPNGRPNSDVLSPWINGHDVARRPAGKWIIDFGDSMSETDAALYEAPFTHVANHVKPKRQKTRELESRKYWYRHWNTRPNMWRALLGLPRFIATPTVSKYRLFVWLSAGVCPDHQLIVFARDDDVTFGILHSRFHEIWSLRLGTSLEDRPRYTPTTTFGTFPFPRGFSPDIPAISYSGDPRAVAIADASRRLVELRDRWLNPPEWIKWVEEPVPGLPLRPVARNGAAAKKLESRTLTSLYNERPQWLADAHNSLNAAVATAYGWEAEISDDEALKNLLALNLKS